MRSKPTYYRKTGLSVWYNASAPHVSYSFLYLLPFHISSLSPVLSPSDAPPCACSATATSVVRCSAATSSVVRRSTILRRCSAVRLLHRRTLCCHCQDFLVSSACMFLARIHRLVVPKGHLHQLHCHRPPLERNTNGLR